MGINVSSILKFHSEASWDQSPLKIPIYGMLLLRLGLQIWFHPQDWFIHTWWTCAPSERNVPNNLLGLVVWVPVYQEAEWRQTFLLDRIHNFFFLLVTFNCSEILLCYNLCILVQVNDTQWITLFFSFFFFSL